MLPRPHSAHIPIRGSTYTPPTRDMSIPRSAPLTPPRASRRLLTVSVAVLLCLSCAPVPLAPRGSPARTSFTGTRSGTPAQFNQSCGAACGAPVAPGTGEILAPTVTRAGQVLEKVVQATEALNGLLIVSKFLDEAQKAKAEKILAECASVANFKVNEELFGEGKSLPESECLKKPTVANPTADTWGQHLGNLKHKAAFLCVQERLTKEFPHNFSIEPRYRQDKMTKDVMLTDRKSGSLRPDVVLHFTRNATRIQCIYDFKFPCLRKDRINPLKDSDIRDQLKAYFDLERSCIPAIVTPAHGVYRPAPDSL